MSWRYGHILVVDRTVLAILAILAIAVALIAIYYPEWLGLKKEAVVPIERKVEVKVTIGDYFTTLPDTPETYTAQLPTEVTVYIYDEDKELIANPTLKTATESTFTTTVTLTEKFYIAVSYTNATDFYIVYPAIVDIANPDYAGTVKVYPVYVPATTDKVELPVYFVKVGNITSIDAFDATIDVSVTPTIVSVGGVLSTTSYSELKNVTIVITPNSTALYPVSFTFMGTTFTPVNKSNAWVVSLGDLIFTDITGFDFSVSFNATATGTYTVTYEIWFTDPTGTNVKLTATDTQTITIQ